MYLIAGLGNPGKKYEGTRHNVGFMAIDVIAHELETSVERIKFKGLLGETVFNEEKILLLKPQTYMNLSGQSIVDAMNFYKIPLDKLIVIYDDMDLPIGRLRIRPEGSSGGHKGMDSIIYQLASDKFARIRIGIGRPKQEHTADYVLGEFNDEEMCKIKDVIQTAAQAAICIVKDGISKAMNMYNGFKSQD